MEELNGWASEEEDGDPAAGPLLLDIAGWFEAAPAWLASAVLHLTLLLLAALFLTGARPKERLELTAAFSDDLGEQLIEESFDLSAANLELEVEEQLLTPTDLIPVDDPLATPPDLALSPEGPAFATDLASVTPGAALSGREAGTKEALLKAFGGTEQTEKAVLDGLKWLKRQQLKDGSWSLKGPYKSGARVENQEAATAMALLAFQGAGHLPRSDSPFNREVRKGWAWLLDQQREDGSLFSNGSSNHRFYTHAQCTIALCELLAMTGDDRYREPATRAVDYLIKTQTEEGGWKYKPLFNSDLSVTGWVLMALKSARMAGIPVPSPVFMRIGEFLDTVQKEDREGYGELGSRYVYESSDVFNRERVPTMTATGLLCRQYLGWPSTDARLKQGVTFLLEHLPEWRRGKIDVYYWYYATQVCHHIGGASWTAWNEVMREMLPANQVTRGRENGSWEPGDDTWGPLGGRLYETCLAIYTLEIYYRHLPLYKQEAVK